MHIQYTHILGFDSPNKNYFVQLMDQDETYYSILHYNPNWMLLTFLKGTTRLPFGFYKPDQTYKSPNKMMEHFPLIICTDVVVPTYPLSAKVPPQPSWVFSSGTHLPKRWWRKLLSKWHTWYLKSICLVALLWRRELT